MLLFVLRTEQTWNDWISSSNNDNKPTTATHGIQTLYPHTLPNGITTQQSCGPPSSSAANFPKHGGTRLAIPAAKAYNNDDPTTATN